MEHGVLEMAAEPELTDEMFGRCADFAVQLSEAACQRFPLDWLWTGDDVASQRSLVMSPATWRQDDQAAPGARVRRRQGALALGGLSLLRGAAADHRRPGGNGPGRAQSDPVQLSRHGAVGVEAGVRRASFRSWAGWTRRICLPTGTVDEVRRATRRLIDGMTGDGGGYILAASHTIPPETPLENIFAMYAEAGLEPRGDLRSRRRRPGWIESNDLGGRRLDMKDVIYVICAALGLLLVGAGLAEIQGGGVAQRHGDIPAPIRDALFAPVERSSPAGMVPAASVLYLLFGYILQMIGCALYAENRGRSALFGLLGLLSPIGYVFLALLNPAPRPVPQDSQVGRGG